MEAVVAMTNGKVYQAFRVFENGKASMDLGSGIYTIDDFASFFIDLCERGWRKVTETEILTHKAKVKTQDVVRHGNDRKGILPQFDGFRQDWYNYMSECGNNQEYDFCLEV